MKQLLASFIAVAFISTGGLALAQDKKDETKQEQKKADKPAASKAKDDKAAKTKKKKKEGC